MMKIVATALRWTARILRAHERAGSPRANDAPQMRGVFLGGGGSVDSWTLGLKAFCHRHPTGPHPEWTRADSVDSRKGESTGTSLALGVRPLDHRLQQDLAAGADVGLARVLDLVVADAVLAGHE